MTDPFSVTVGVITVVGVAYSSAKTLRNLISNFENAPKVFGDIGVDLDNLQGLLQALKQPLSGVANKDLTDEEKACFESLTPALKACDNTCTEFAAKVSQMTSHSRTEKMSWWDRARLHSNEKDVALLRADLERHKQTIDIAIGVATLRLTSKQSGRVQTIETQIARSVDSFTGQIVGLETALQSMTAAASTVSQANIDAVTNTLSEHAHVLKLCLQCCTSGLRATTNKLGTQVKYAASFEQAKQVIGSMGDNTTSVHPTNVTYAEARGQSRQFVGPMSGDVANNFWRD